MVYDRALRPFVSFGSWIALALASACAQPAASTLPEPASSEPAPALTQPAQVSPKSVMDNAIYTPDPDQKALQNTAAARFHKSDGSAVIGYCIDVQGQTIDLHVIEPFPGDTKIDEVLIATIGKWRFRPFLVDGRPIKTCTKETFKLHFTAPPKTVTDAEPSEALEPLPDSLERDVCEHTLALTAARLPERPTQAKLEQMVHACFELMRAEREKVGDTAFERKASCVLAAESVEQAVATCNP